MEMLDMQSVMADHAERPVNIQALCRLCLSERFDSLKSIFDEALSPNRLPQKIQQLLLVQVSRNDKLSTMVCNDCIIRLDTWFSYKRQCHRNQTKLAEWLSKSTGQSVLDMNVHIKSEPLDIDTARHGLLPVKVEFPMYNDMVDEEFNDLPPTLATYPHEVNDHVYLEDFRRDSQESEENSVKCSDCGKVFGNANNRRRHQNMAHRKDKRAQMMEIRKPEPPPEPESQPEEKVEQSIASGDDLSAATATINSSSENYSITNDSNTQSLNNPEMDANVSEMDSTVSKIDTTVSEMNATVSEMDTTGLEINTTAEAPKEDSNSSQNETITEHKSEEEPSSKDNLETPDENIESFKENQDNSTDNSETLNENPTEEKPSEENPDKTNENPVEFENDQQKIEFAAGLKLVQKDSTPIEFEALSKLELSYIEKCKAMVSMFHTLQCACHNVQHKTLRYLLSHLREMRVWFPLFTCYSCMISFTDRSTFTRHHSKCPRSQLETLIKLSNLRKRSEIKTRLYQNYKCNRCKFLYSFHEDFCKHINEDHAAGTPPFYCSCRYVFDSLEEYKTHCYTSCVLSYYCDICFITTVTLEEFVKHCQEIHDTSEGFVLLQEDSYTPRNYTFRHKEADDESNVIEGKRERRKSIKEPIMVQIYDRAIPPDPKEIPTKVLRKMIHLDHQPTTAHEWNRQPARCPVCKKEYSSVNNMIRHYRTHIERKEIELPIQNDDTGEGNEDLYSCPECGGVYAPASWKKHIQENHPAMSCNECDKVFQFQTELDQHRSVHLNLKVYRDSKTHSYKTAIISPGAETNGIVGDVMVMCEVCDTMFNSKEELKHHKLAQHDMSSMSRASSSTENFEMPVEEEFQPKMEIEDPLDFGGSGTSDSPSIEKIPCDACGKIYSSTKSLKEHVMNKHGLEYVKKSEYPKKCDYCDKVCSSGAGLALHTQIHERANPDKKGDFPKKCEYCDKICTTGAGLYLHTQMHERMTLGDLKKDKPEFISERKISVDQDQEEEDEDESYHTCKRCFKVFGTKYKLKDHMRSHGINPSKPGPKPGFKKNRKILCDLCHIALDNSADLEKHKAEEHSDELDGMPTLTSEMEIDEENAPLVYTCDICVETFDSKLELMQHKETHGKPIVPKTKSTLIYCKFCKIAFDSVNDLTKHMHVEHGETAKPKVIRDKHGDNSDKPFKCPICSKGFGTHGAMTAHCGWHKRAGSTLEIPGRRTNTPQASAAAKMAKTTKVLKKVAEAAANKQQPIQPPEFQCTTCFMELPNDTALQIHILEKHRSLDSLMLIPRCHTCNQDFVTQEEYETHKRFHDFLVRQKKHEQQMQAQQQMQTPVIHSVQTVSDSPQNVPKKYPCNWCNSIFSRSDTLNTHVRQHHKDHVRTEFECTQCDRVFDKQNSLTIHLKVHEKQKNAAIATSTVVGNGVSGGGKVYSCSICSRGFSFPKDLRMHTINAHPF